MSTPSTSLPVAGRSRPVTEFDPAVVQGAHFRSVSVPEVATPGDTITISGNLHYDNVTSPISKKDCRVRVESPILNRPAQSETYSLAHCQSRVFDVTIDAVGQEGETVPLTVKAQNNTVAGWQTTETRGPFRVELVSEGEKRAQQALDQLPYALAGAGTGFATAINDSTATQVERAALGAIGGVVTNEALRQLDLRVQFPTVPIAATAGLLGSAALLLTSTDLLLAE